MIVPNILGSIIPYHQPTGGFEHCLSGYIYIYIYMYIYIYVANRDITFNNLYAYHNVKMNMYV